MKKIKDSPLFMARICLIIGMGLVGGLVGFIIYFVRNAPLVTMEVVAIAFSMVAVAYTVILGSQSFFIASRQNEIALRQNENMEKNFTTLYNKMCMLDKKIEELKSENGKSQTRSKRE